MAFAGLSNWFKKRVEDVRDVFDANTAADQQRRLAAGQPRYYQQQQAQRNQASLSGTNRGGMQQVGYNLAGGLSDILKAPGAVLDLKASLDKTPAGQVANLANPLNLGQNIANIGKDALTRKPVGTTTFNQNTQMQAFGRGAQDLLSDKVQQSRFGQRESDNKWIAGPSRAIGNVGGQIAAGIASGGSTFPSLAMGAQTFSDEQKNAKLAGKSDNAAFGIGALQGVASAASEKIGLDKLAGVGGSFVAKTGKRLLTEGAQEGSQQFIQNLITNKTYNPQQSLTQGVGDSVIFGGIAGGVAGPAFDFKPAEVKQNNKLLLSKQVGAVGKDVNQPRIRPLNTTEDGSQRVLDTNPNKLNQATSQRAYHSTSALEIQGGRLRASVDGSMGPGVYLSRDKDDAMLQAAYQADGNILDQTVYEVNIPTSKIKKFVGKTNYPTPAQVDKAKKQGYRGIEVGGEIVVFDPENVKLVGRNVNQPNKPTQASPKTNPVDPKGFIVKETKPRNGRVDTIRISTNPSTGKMQSTVQSELTPEVKSYAATFNVTPEQAVKDLAMSSQPNTTGTASALAKVQNSGKSNVVKDLQDQQDYGVKEIQAEPTNTIDAVINKYLGIDELTSEQLDTSMPKYRALGAVTNAREAVRKTNVLRAANDLVARGFERTSRGGVVSRKFTRALQYINKNAGQDPAMIQAAQKYAGENTFADSGLLELGKQVYDLIPSDQSRQRVHAVLDPETVDGAVKIDDLSPQEQQAALQLRDLGDAINDTSYRAGFISKKKWESNRGGRYIARLYNEIATAEDVADLLELPDKRGLHLGMYKSRQDFNDDLRQRLIRDPIKLAVIRARQVRQNEALIDYMHTAESKGYVRNSPTPGFVKISPQNRMANWAGKYVRQDVYENIEGFKALGKGMNALNSVLDVYDGNPLRRMRKKMLTIYNPVVRTGNVASNYFFAYLNGVNPVTFQKNKHWAHKAMKSNDPLMVAAQKSGLIGNDIIRTDKNIFNKDKAFLTELDKNSLSLTKKALRLPATADEKLSKRYGNADDIAKLAALKSHVDRGIPVNRAVEMTRRGFQDYTRVGHAYDMAAKSPIFGNAFIRFQGDLYFNIIKNAAVDHPFRLAALVGGMAALGEGLSNLSGESEEDKKTREDRPGAPKIPFTNISTEFQTPFGAVDVARFTPLYMRQDVDGNSLSDNISRLSPFNVFNPFNTNKQEVVKKAASDPLIGPLISIAGDTDWRGKSVADPEGVRNGKNLFPDDPLSATERNRNRLQYGVRSYAPYPSNEVGDILAAINQNKRNEQTQPGGKGDPSKENAPIMSREGFNTAGSLKTTGQAFARLFGVRAEKFGSDEAAKKREQDLLFEYFKKQDDLKATFDDETRKAFENRHKGTQTRSGIQQEFENDPWYKYKNASELLDNPKLFEAERKYAQLQNQFDGKPIDPIYDLPEDQRKIVLAKKLKLPGAKDEGFNTLYSQEWYQDFRQKQDQYYASKKAYNESRGFKQQEEVNPYPETAPELQKAMDFYMKLPKGTGERSGFIRNNPGVWAAMTNQWKAQDDWEDRERQRLGLPAIPREDKSQNKYASSGGRKRKTTGVKVAGSSSVPNYVKGLKVKSYRAPSSSLRIAQPRSGGGVKVRLAKQAKTIKKA